MRLNNFINKKELYLIVDDKGKVIKKFRLKMTAINFIVSNKKNYFSKLKVVEKDE